MGKQVPWEDIVTQTVLPKGFFDVRIESLDEDVTRGNPGSKLPAGCYLIRATYRIEDHPATRAFVNFASFDSFIIGSAEDPNANDPKTWRDSIGGKRLKRMLQAAGVTLHPQIDRVLKAATDTRLTIKLGFRKDAEDEQNEVKGYWARGEKVPVIEAATARPAGAMGAAAGATAQTAAARLPAPTPTNRVAARTPAHATADDGDGGESDTGGSGGGDGAARASETATGRRTAATRKKTVQLTCEECNEVVAAADYKVHMESVHGDD